MEKVKVLLFDDEEIYKSRLLNFLKDEGCSLEIADDTSALLAEAKSGNYGLCFLSEDMAGKSGVAYAKQFAAFPTAPRIFLMHQKPQANIRAEIGESSGVTLIRKPFQVDELREPLRKAIAQMTNGAKAEPEAPGNQLKGQHPSMLKVQDVIIKVAATDSTVLVMGESGTGKEVVARAIHQASSRRKRLLVAVNCGAIPENLLESELFGHVRGAFTGATADRDGRFYQADKGSIFLDEVGELPLGMQVKLLRVLQERTFEPVGAASSVSVDVRIIAATNRDLERGVREKSFREDLFYRLNVVPVSLPALRERKSDIPLLADHFLKACNRKNRRTIEGFNHDVLELFMDYHWPGNVRELENLIERLTIFRNDGLVQVEDLPDKIRFPGVHRGELLFELPEQGLDLNATLEKVENNLLIQALNRTAGNKQQAANLLGLNRTTLVEKLKKKKLFQDLL